MGTGWGRYWRSRDYVAKQRVEQCITLSLSWMLQSNYLDLGMGQVGNHAIVWRNYDDLPVYALTADLERVSPHGMRLYLRNSDLSGGQIWKTPGTRKTGSGFYGVAV